MSDPSGGNLPPGGSGKGSNAKDSAPGVAPTIHQQPVRPTAESLPDPDGWGMASEPPIVGMPVKSAAAYADTALLPAYDPPKPRSPDAVAMPIDGPTIVPTGESTRPAPIAATHAPVAQVSAAPTPAATAPFAAHQQDLPPHDAPMNGDAPSAGPFVTQRPPPVVAVQASPQGAHGPSAGAKRSGGIPQQQLVLLASAVGGLFLLLGIVIGIVVIARPKPPPPIAIESPVPPAPEPAAAPPPEPAIPSPAAPTPVTTPVPRSKTKKDGKDAGAAPASSAKPGSSSTPSPSASTGGPGATPGGATSSDAGRRGGRKVPH